MTNMSFPAAIPREIRNFLKGCSLTTALFVFQACYGTAQGLDWEVRDINFRVLNTEGAALNKAKILMKENRTFTKWKDSVETDNNGFATLTCSYIPARSYQPVFRIEADGYTGKDTVANAKLLDADEVIIRLKKSPTF